MGVSCMKHILIVDDEPGLVKGLRLSLEHAGFRVSTAADGRDALEKVATGDFDLILLDLMLPEVDGLTVCREVRQKSRTPIIMLTARADEELRVRLLAQGVQEYLNKPFSVAELLARVEGLVASRRHTLETLRHSAERLRRLAEFVEQVAAVRDQSGLTSTVCRAVRELTGADGVTFVLRDGEYCHYVDEDAVQPLWKGLHFPLEACISGWVMLHREPALIEDIYVDPRIPYAAYRPTFVKSLSMLPIGRDNPEGAIGCYWAERHQASAEELELHQALADASSVGLSNIRLFQKLESARQTAEQSAAALQEAQRLAGLGNWRWDVASDTHTWSEEVYLIYGRDPALPPAVYPEVQSYFTPESWANLAAAVETALKDGVPYEIDAEVVRLDGSHRWITARGDVTRDGAGKVVDLHGTVQDITERKNAEEEIRYLNADLERRVAERTAELSSANKELDSFAYAVSHDLRAPLRAMSGFSQALIEDYGGALEGEAKSYLEQIALAGRKMGELVDGILVLSRSTRGELRRDAMDVSALAAKLLDELARDESERDYAWEVEPGLSVTGDARMIEAVMRNLLGNAWKYSAHAVQPHIRVYGEMRGDTEWVCVADNGAGFDVAYADRLFQPFQRLHRQDEFPGIGIGLATVQRIVHRHGGAIEARGEPGKGAVFCFNLSGKPADFKEIE